MKMKDGDGWYPPLLFHIQRAEDPHEGHLVQPLIWAQVLLGNENICSRETND